MGAKYYSQIGYPEYDAALGHSESSLESEVFEKGARGTDAPR